MARVDDVCAQRTRPDTALVGNVDLGRPQTRVMLCGALQFEHQMLALEQIAMLRFTAPLVVQFLESVEIPRRAATASATWMPSTAAESMPPAYPAPSPQG